MKTVKRIAVLLCFASVLVMPAQSLAPVDGTYLRYEQTPGTPKGGIMDFSWLNEMPAGDRGFVTVRDGDFVFEDGTPVRFWGVNLGFGSATPEKEVAEAMAAELACSGVNFVRLHALDTTYGGIVDFSGYESGGKTGALLEDSLDKMDYLIYCLKEKGIYIHLDMHAGRVVSTGDGFTEEEAGYLQDMTMRGYHVLVERVAEIELAHAKQVMDHKNPYTGLRYCDDPVFAVVQLMNESSVLWLQQPDVSNVLTEQLRLRFNAWLLEKYGSRPALAEAWTNEDGVCALFDYEDPAAGTVESLALGSWGEKMIDRSASFWGFTSPPRYADFMLFLIEVQNGVFDAFYSALREMGYRGAINCSNYPVGPIDLFLNSRGDVTEKNTYWNFPQGGYSVPCSFPRSVMTYENPRITSLYLPSQMTTASVADRATVITEWAATSPTEFKADAVFQVACYAALQDWDGLCMFNYSFDGSAGYFSAKSYTDFFAFHMDPASFGQFGICAAVFRGGLVREAVNSIEYVYTDQDILANSTALGNRTGLSSVFVSKFSYRFISGKYDGDADLVIASGNTAGGDYTSARHLLLQALNGYSTPFRKEYLLDEWLDDYKQSGLSPVAFGEVEVLAGEKYALLPPSLSLSSTLYSDVIDNAMRHFGLLEEGRGFSGEQVVSDTGELTFDYGKCNFTAVTDSAVIITGEPGEEINAGGVRLAVSNPLAAVGILAMDEKPISGADRIFIYAMGTSFSEGMTWDRETLTGLGGGDILFEDIRGTLFLPVTAKGCAVWGLDSDGKRAAEVPVEKADGGYAITLGGYCYYELSAQKDPGGLSGIQIFGIAAGAAVLLCAAGALTAKRIRRKGAPAEPASK